MRLGDIARALGAQLEGDPDLEIAGLAPIEEAGPGSLTFLADQRLARHLATTRASAVILPANGPAIRAAALRAANPYLAFAQALALFHPPTRPAPGIHPTAVVAPDASVGPDAHVGPHVVIGAGARIGAGAILHANVTLYPGVQIGAGFVAHAGAVVREDVVIGDRVTLHAGAVIGSDGFGFVPMPDGHRKIPQVGRVVLEDDVEIGANATIDRATMGETRVGRGTKIDNLVMVGHGCHIGPGCLLAGQVGLAGSTRVGAWVMMGGQVGAAGHLTIGDGAQLAAQSGIHQDVPPKAILAGTPAVDVRAWRRASAISGRLPGLFRRLRRLEKALGLGGTPDERGEDGE